jgi:Tfp pilus assembly protein FimT
VRIKGFSLLELFVLLGVLSILALICIPNLSPLVHQNEQKALINELERAIQYTKLQAISHGHSLILTPLDDALDWSNGMVLTQFNNRTNNMEQVHQWQWHHPNWNIVWLGAHSSRTISISNNPTKAMSNGRFILTNNRTNYKITLVLNKLGRIRVC